VAIAVLFSLQVAADVTVGEGDLPAVLDAAIDKIGHDRLRGRLIMLVTGQPVAYVEDDDREFTVQQLLEALPELSAGRGSGIGFSEAPGRVELRPAGGDMWVAGEYFKPLTAPAAELLPALLACCERFMAFVRKTFVDRPDVLERIAQLDPWLAAARDAVSGAS
jgi:hypothetical protein